MTGEYLRLLNRDGRDARVEVPAELAALVEAVAAGEVSRTQRGARCSSGASRPATAPRRSSPTRGLRQISDAGALGAAIDDVLAANPAAVADYRAGKGQAIGFLVGQVMKATRGQANAALVQAALRERLDRAEEG